MNDDTILAIHHVHKAYGAEFALRLDELAIRRGETLALLGPTGSGKSTLLRILGGLEQCIGEIKFGGTTVSPGAMTLAQRRRVALVHQRPQLLNRSVWSNVEYGLRLRGATSHQQVEEMLRHCGLMPFARQAARTLSGGQMQLVALARALVVEPEVLLLDEPTANLDPAHVELVERLVADYQRRTRATIVWATHNLFQARRVAQRAALLLNGQLVELADRDTFFDLPADPRTLAFTQGRMVY